MSACNIDKHQKIEKNSLTFATTANSVIFFKNLRQTYYDKQENAVAKVDIYRNKKRTKSETAPLIDLAIVHHWRNDKAFVMVEPNEVLNKEPRIEVNWQDTVKHTQGKYIFDFGDMELHYQFALSVYTSIQERHVLFIKIAGKWEEFMPQEEDKEIFRKTMLDYLRLVNAVK